MTLTATGDTATYHWDLGDGTAADGPVVQHTYAAGRFTARVTATNLLGETSQATVAITATGLTLAGPGAGRYQQLARFHGRLVPAVKGARIALYRNGTRLATVRAGRDGSFFVRGRVGTPDARYTVRYAGAVSNAVALAVRPGLDTAFSGSGRLGHAARAARPRAPGDGGNREREGLARAPARRRPLLPRPPAPAPGHRLARAPTASG